MDDADTKALAQLYGGLVEVLVDPSSGLPSPIQSTSIAPLLLNYLSFKDGGCYTTARPMSLTEYVQRLKGVTNMCD